MTLITYGGEVLGTYIYSGYRMLKMELPGKSKRDRPQRRFMNVVRPGRDVGCAGNRMLRMELPDKRRGERPK